MINSKNSRGKQWNNYASMKNKIKLIQFQQPEMKHAGKKHNSNITEN